MNIKAFLAVFYVLAFIVAFGHASNNDRISNSEVPFASMFWPLYVSHELWHDDD